ncbi:MAG: hypothetical protein Ct9H300mP1_37300 [Planctomycetaceae bacterium]|nr:MAG: hypothetical protein Ct9H300mP1_37300 [Planctomycetaceae bacterium]
MAVVVGTAIPLGNLIFDGAPGWASAWRGEHRLGPTLIHAGRSLLPTVAVAVAAAITAGWLLRRRHPGLLVALSLPGPLGSLSLGLLLTWTLLIMAPAGFGHSIGALLIGQSLWLLPRAALLIVLLAVVPHRESTPTCPGCCNTLRPLPRESPAGDWPGSTLVNASPGWSACCAGGGTSN